MVVLVVEDEVLIAYSTTAELEEAGHVVVGPAHSSAEALQLARRYAPEVALIDIDLEVPGAGVELAHRLRAEHDVVIVFTTGQTDLARAHADCALGVIAKPYDPTELSEIVEYAGSMRRDGRAAAPLRRSFEHFERRCTRRRSDWRSEPKHRRPPTVARRGP